MRKLLATLVLAVVLVGACGGGSDKKSSDTTVEGSATTLTGAGAAAAGGAFGDFCAARAGFSAPNPTAGGDLKASLESANTALEKASKNAPSEIKGDVATVAAAYRKFFDAVKAANYDFTKINPAEIQAISTGDVQTAGQHITDWVAAHCK